MKACAFPGCALPVRVNPTEPHSQYCSLDHANRAKSLSLKKSNVGIREHNRTTLRHTVEGSTVMSETRQQLARHRFTLGFDPAIRILPPLPAPLHLGPDGRPLPFQDDLRAIQDHGSPRALSGPEQAR
jgi:hypothetical protein